MDTERTLRRAIKIERDERSRRNTIIRKKRGVEIIEQQEIEMENELLELGKTELPTMPNWHMNIDGEGLNEHFEEQDRYLKKNSLVASEEPEDSKMRSEEVAQHPNVLEDSFVQIEVMNAAEKLRLYHDRCPCLKCRKSLMKMRM